MKTKRITLKGFVNVINIKPQIEAIKKQYPDYKEKPNMSPTPNDYKNSNKVYIYGWYWRGEWADQTKEHFSTLYKPKTV